jgi:nucleoside 2-deoxyribosyltransferase
MPSAKKINSKELIRAIESGKSAKDIMKEFNIKTTGKLKELYLNALIETHPKGSSIKYTIFISAALFTYAEQEFNRRLRDVLISAGYNVILPQEFIKEKHDEEFFDQCVNGIDQADIVLAMVEGVEVDAGVGFEIGFAYAKGTPVIALRTDFRHGFESFNGCLNIMLHFGVTKIVNLTDDPFQDAVNAILELLNESEIFGGRQT